LVQLFSSSSELFVVGHGSGVYDTSGLTLSAGSGSRLRSGALRVNLGSREAARGVGAGGMLNILAMLGDEGAGKLLEFLAQLRHDL
jgi:hypothetical protein